MEHFPVLNKQYPFGMACGLDAVGNHQDGLSVFVDGVKKRQKFVCRLRIQRAGRLVCQDQLGLVMIALAIAALCFWPPDTS